MGFPSQGIREEKEIKGIQIGKEDTKLSLFASDMILHIENLKDATRKLLINSVSCKIQNIQISFEFLFTNSERENNYKKNIIPRNKAT